jgi:hypothetical protein
MEADTSCMEPLHDDYAKPRTSCAETDRNMPLMLAHHRRRSLRGSSRAASSVAGSGRTALRAAMALRFIVPTY